MSSTSNPARIRSVYRSILRELPPRPLLASPAAPLHKRIRDNFRQPPPRTQANPSAAVQHAEQFLSYLRAQRTYVQLIERYNPSIDMDEEERVRLTARRVGMDLPPEFSSGGEGRK
ncbi:ras guanyl-nucleotide exchange factor [Coniochaeta sp. 2T2.1]|nr:ras guanyl-nucleotide exchange factor [Coniochaeta sp. 2T2.1]